MVPVLLTGLAGCASMGMDRGPVEPMAEGESPVIDNTQIASELERRPQLSEHVRVGVYFLAPTKVVGEGEATWRWDAEERQQIVQAAETVDRFELFPIAEQLVSGTDVVSLRLAGARSGADAILVVDGRAEQRSRANGWVATYPLILPIFFAPAQELDTLFRSEATLYDVRNGFLYATAEAESEQSQRRAHLWIDREGGVEETRREVVDLLAAELTRRLENLAGERPAGATSRIAEDDATEEAESSQTSDG